jgi:hypothetical protein
MQSVVPTNITFFHFMRENDIYMHYVAIKYALKFGDDLVMIKNYNKSKIFGEKNNEKNNLIELLIEWLFDLISYRCSALYIESCTIDRLIEQSYFLLNRIFKVYWHEKEFIEI